MQAIFILKAKKEIFKLEKMPRRAAAAALIPSASGLGEEATIFHIETVLKRRKKKSKVEYLIRWSGFDAAHNSWEPRVQLVADGNGPLLEEFDEGEASKKRKVSDGV